MPAAIERARHSEQAEKSEKEQDVPSKVLAVVKPTASPASPMKHPLEHKWALWWYKNDRALSWEENQKIVSSFDTIEDFWALLHHIEKASNLDSGCDYR